MRALAVAVASALLAAIACSESRDAAPPAAQAAEPARAAAAPAKPAAAPAPTRDPRQKPLPAFEGSTLDGERLAIRDRVGKRILLFFFNPEVRDAAGVAKVVRVIAELRGPHNFEVIGVATGSSAEKIRSFLSEHHLDFPVIDDSSARIASQLALRAPVALVGVDAEGYLSFAYGNLALEGEDGAGALEAQLREALRLPETGPAVAPTLGELPRAPDFRAERLEGGPLFESASLRGRPAILVFFLHTCPHCHTAFASIKQSLDGFPEPKRPALVGVSLVARPAEVKEEMAKHKLDSFPILLDADATIQRAYGVVAGVPQIFLIDAQGLIQARVQGWRDDRDPPLMRMRLAALASQPVPMLLHEKGYSGNEFCAVCHPGEHETWLLTNHAAAFDTLVKHGVERDSECVSCHVVGFGQEGGYSFVPPTPQFEGVGCESCHGRGGPHLSPGFVANGSYEAACVTCHNPTHSLGFDYAGFLPRVSHASNAHLAALPLAEKRKLLAERSKPRSDLLPVGADPVGSDACQGCHAAEYETWAKSPHAKALASLEKKGKARDPACLACHTTAYGRAGGFPAGGSPAEHPDLSRVGCESCHGPGGEHVKEGARRIGTIVSLGDKCDSCVILQICGACHDDANDPGFEFEVKTKIDAQRHGTIEPGTGKPLKAARSHGVPKAADTRELPTTAWIGALEAAFAASDR